MNTYTISPVFNHWQVLRNGHYIGSFLQKEPAFACAVMFNNCEAYMENLPKCEVLEFKR